MTPEEPDQIPTDYTVGEAWLVYRPVMDYEESETPYCICLTEELAEETRKELVRFAEDLASKLPSLESGERVPVIARLEAVNKVTWPLGIRLDSDFEFWKEVVTFDASSIAVCKLPLVQPR